MPTLTSTDKWTCVCSTLLAGQSCGIVNASQARVPRHARIIVQQLHGHWSAWWEHEPQIAFGGATTAEALDRLVGFVSG